jgi:hypothetical protein
LRGGTGKQDFIFRNKHHPSLMHLLTIKNTIRDQQALLLRDQRKQACAIEKE